MTDEFATIPVESIERSILLIRGQKVILDRTLAKLYGVSTKALNQAVKRNPQRFPPDFMFQLTMEEAKAEGSTQGSVLRSQIVTLRIGHGRHRKYLPLAFTEHGAIMAAMILNSPRAIQMSVYVERAFVRFRMSSSISKDLARELEVLRRSVATLDADTRQQFDQVYEAILGLMAAPVQKQ